MDILSALNELSDQLKSLKGKPDIVFLGIETHLGSKGLRKRIRINKKFYYHKNAIKQRNKNTKRKNK